MKKKMSTIFLLLIFLVGLSLLLYPTVSNYINALHQTTAVINYTSELTGMDKEVYDEIWNKAVEYNQKLARNGINYHMSEQDLEEYHSQLKISDSGVIGFISIPVINCELPIYHGTNEGTLSKGIGHIEWSALPVGGEGTHSVLSGHRGLPSARLFTDIDRLVEGDVFQITVLNHVLTYEVDQISIVLPIETAKLEPVAGEDYCTLVTCTPYGVNSHRLLVRGTRIETPEIHQSIGVVSNAIRIDPLRIAPIFAALILLLLGIFMFCTEVIRNLRRKHEGSEIKK